MRRNIGKPYIKKDRKVNLVLTLITIVVVLMITAVIELLPNRVPELGYSELNGVGRSFLFPFVFQDDKNNLYLLDESRNVTAIDDSAEGAVHDSENGKVYYTKQNVLYEYTLQSNNRVILCDNTSRFHLLGNRRAIVCLAPSGQLHLYLFKGKQVQQLTESSEVPKEGRYTVSSEGVLYADGARLIYCDYLGRAETVSEKLNPSKPFYFSENGKNVCYYEEDQMYLSETNGTVILSIRNGEPVQMQEEPLLVEPSTRERSSNAGIPFRYFLNDIAAVYSPGNHNEEMYTTGKLQYFTGDGFDSIAENVYKVLYYSQAEDFVLFSVVDGDQMDIYLSSKGGKPKKQVRCGIGAQCVFDDRSNYLYYQESDGTLYRYDIYDVKLKTVKIAENTGNLYDYFNKPFVAYDDAAHEQLYLILKNKVERIDPVREKRLYGRNSELYLLCRQNADHFMTVDYVVEDKMTRISNCAAANLFFDRDLEYIVYLENGTLSVWHRGEVSQVGEFKEIKSVDIIK